MTAVYQSFYSFPFWKNIKGGLPLLRGLYNIRAEDGWHSLYVLDEINYHPAEKQKDKLKDFVSLVIIHMLFALSELHAVIVKDTAFYSPTATANEYWPLSWKDLIL